MTEAQFGALIAPVFNIGEGNLAASTLLRKPNAGDGADAADQFLAWDKARVNGVLQAVAGLTQRRQAERAMFLGQDWRAVAATRGRSTPPVLPAPARPAEDAAALEWLGAKKAIVKKASAKKAAVKKAAVRRTVPRKPARKAAYA